MKAVKKQIMLIAVCAVICVSVFVSWKINQPKNADEAMDEMTAAQQEQADENADEDEQAKVLGEAEFVSKTDEYFDGARLNRQETRDEAVRILNEVVENENSTEEDRAAAQEKLLALSDAADAEGRIENLVKAKGYAECVAMIGDETVNVIVQSDGLEAADVIAIKDIAVAETAQSAENVKIIESK